MPDNQTLDEWFLHPQIVNDPNARGTGVAIARPGSGKDHFSDVTYDEMLDNDRLFQFYCFAWVPHVIATETQVQNAACGGRCSQSCVTPGCLCDRSLGRCA
jgi:hypothetical protein